MQGKDYTFTIQAINKNKKMSLISEPGIFTVGKTTQSNTSVPTK